VTITYREVKTMEKMQFLYMGIEAVVFCIPIGALIWKAGGQSQTIKDHEKRIVELEGSVEKAMLPELNELKVDIAEIKTAIIYIKERLS
jgi:hypothetical protein